MGESEKYNKRLQLARLEKEDETLPPFADRIRERTLDVMPDETKMIEVGPNDETQTIGTSSLTGCVAIGVVVEDSNGKRRCGLAHYSMSEGITPEHIFECIDNEVRFEGCKWVKQGLIVMTSTPERLTKELVGRLLIVSGGLISDDDITIIKYDNAIQDNEKLEISVPNHTNGPPSFRTCMESGSLDW